MILIFYALLQYQRLIFYGEPQIMRNVLLSHYSTDDEFTTEDDGIMIAFGLTAYDSNREPIDDPTYGTL